MEIMSSTIDDIDKIFCLYDDAIEYQKKVFTKQWEGFERNLIERELREHRQWKIVINDEVAAIFAISFNDKLLWKENDDQPSIYIHRIVTHSKFRGAAFMLTIIDWAKQYAKKKEKNFIRMDTWGDNQRLIDYYVKCGFTHIDTVPIIKTDSLPSHYKFNETLALLEIRI